MHKLLARQIKKFIDQNGEIPEQLQAFVQAIDDAYNDFDSDRIMLERARQLSDQDFSEHNKRLKDAVSKISDKVATLSTSINELSHSTQLSVDEINRSNSEAQKGQLLLANTLNMLEHLFTAINNANESVANLATGAKKITNITGSIKNIAAQTNLLALNANIESARAGKYGKGFKVVADEVKILARRSYDATEEIKLVLQDLSSKVDQAVELMKTNHESATKIMQASKEINEILGQILSSVDSVNNVSMQINAVIKEQSTTATHMYEELQLLVNMTS